jgi:hypothetical protein
MPGMAVSELEFNNGEWIERIRDLLSLPRVKPQRVNGADQTGSLIAGLVE